MTEFKNEFSWSKSRDELFNECKKRYYFEKYGCWGGWKSNASKKIKELYLLKNLSNRYIWIGQVVHDVIHYLLIQLKAGNDVSLSYLLLRLKNRLKEDYNCSKSGLYKKYPKKCGLREHEYNLLILKDEWDKLFDYAEKCITNFYNSDVLRDIKKRKISDWLFLEDFLSFNFEDTKVYLRIDFAIRNEDNKIILYDWKTGKERDVEMDVQLTCYALYVMQKWDLNPEDIIVNRYNVALDKPDEFKITKEMIDKIKDHMRKSINSMSNHLIDKLNNTPKEESEFPKTENKYLCANCNFKKICELEDK